uniref:Uncharacterized protein n=1 Tax=Anopheles dirus TaxID=7168 RepID=A0A182NVX5_9DIPT
MVLQSTAKMLCMACVVRIAPRVRPKRQLRRWYRRTRDQLVRMSRCAGC